ncbi:unnamed protein product [Pleuronectes platessa]|uniref:Uncharacterized protein n=1 Tax=Pleuronectes platessa TaxID=8262 RepID=A0A9N7TI70_PLEPL|nr:unnamed protein product [Pleuronectes platessa]
MDRSRSLLFPLHKLHPFFFSSSSSSSSSSFFFFSPAEDSSVCFWSVKLMVWDGCAQWGGGGQGRVWQLHQRRWDTSGISSIRGCVPVSSFRTLHHWNTSFLLDSRGSEPLIGLCPPLDLFTPRNQNRAHVTPAGS